MEHNKELKEVDLRPIRLNEQSEEQIRLNEQSEHQIMYVAPVTVAKRKSKASKQIKSKARMQKRSGPKATPCKVILQSKIYFLAGLSLLICTEEFHEWLSSLLSSLEMDFLLHYYLDKLKYTPSINQNVNTAISNLLLTGVNFIVFSVPDLTFFTRWFSETFLSTHASLYGTNFDAHYYNILSDLYEQSVDLYQINRNLHDAYDELMEYYVTTVRTDFLRALLASEPAGEHIAVNIDYISRMETMNRIMINFTDRYAEYRNSLQYLETVLQQIQTMNPNFTLPLPSFNPIRVEPLEWLFINWYDENFVWDPVIFQFQNFSNEILDHINAIALNVNNNVDVFVRGELLSTYNQNRQTPTTLPFNSFAPAGSNDIFELETQERRSRARTRRQIRNLPTGITRTRSRSRSGCSTDSDENLPDYD